VVSIDFKLEPQRVVGHPSIRSTQGEGAFERGPVVYCFEQVDQPIPEAISAASPVIVRSEPALLGGVTVLEVGGARAIPYYAWNNRGLHPMAVWRPLK
jgi:DUF1680 family protein